METLASAPIAGQALEIRSIAFERLSAIAAVLDGSGKIIDTNEAWRLFAHHNDGVATATGTGVSYLDVCDRAAQNGAIGAEEVARGLRRILADELDQFEYEYPCDSSSEHRWFLLHASRVTVADETRLVVFHVDITARKELEDQLIASLEASREALTLATRILETLPDRVIVVNYDGDICASNSRWREFASIEDAPNYFDLLRAVLPSIEIDEADVWAAVDALRAGAAEPIAIEFSMAVDDTTTWHRATSQPLLGSNEHFMVIFADITDQRAADTDTIHSQKLEAVGQLAAGIAHEINTPIQFIGDNLRFVGDAMTSLLSLIETYDAVSNLDASPHDRAHLAAERNRADIDFLREEVPEAVTQALGGVERVATIVRALKSFGHPGDTTRQQVADINEIIKTTMIVAQNELKYVTEVHCNFSDLPPVQCFPSDLNQVFLNLLVNAAHAIADVHEQTKQHGSITITTFQEGDNAVITITDTGGGIPDKIQNRIFEPFFTTKSVGRGTGQGLSIARSIITDRHLGQISFETTQGIGTTFRIILPITGLTKG